MDLMLKSGTRQTIRAKAQKVISIADKIEMCFSDEMSR